jgi:hypothetical protein
MNDMGAWTVDLFKHQASHTNGTVVTFENNEISDIDNFPSSTSVHDISALMKSAISAYRQAQEQRSRKPTLSLKKPTSIPSEP